ncbi:hypothetical protein MFUM_270062 [Methylacidiphilum fumariolicum SolV]|uniref:Uncharacterized protein n=2 Tax=Candidatus Methylacidiphilum fumarolicum TaxID=591154 RepID=I0JXJ5_METFB|nr:conserved protein of unknown function [Candidatus Methylacidiphilum fumarolicum]CCG91964.1 hypothetical protein MFUM_270062 [Methylacidiphilum fumariolicum SolV]
MLSKLSKYHKEEGKKRHHLQLISKHTGKTAKARRIRKHKIGGKNDSFVCARGRWKSSGN